MQTLEILSGIAPPDILVKSCGCIGRCGAGPNLVVHPDAVFVSHCGTAARAAQFMTALCGGEDSDASNSLDAYAWRKRAEDEFRKGYFAEADVLLSQAIDLKPCGGIHIIYKVRSSVRLAMGDCFGALEYASQAVTLARQYLEAYICQGDAFLGMDQFDEAEKSYLTCLEIDPSIRRSKSFKARIAKVEEKLSATNICQSN